MKNPMIRAAGLVAATVFSCQAYSMAQTQTPAPSAGQQLNNAADRAGAGARDAASQVGAGAREAANEVGGAARTAGESSGGQARDLMQRGNMSEKELDAHFVKEAAEGNLAEIQIGQLAEQKSQDPQVKQFAQMLVQDHTAANAQLKQAAQAKSIEFPTDAGPVHQAILQELQKKEGPDFDRHFLFGQVADHVKDVLMYRSASQLVQDQQLKQWAQQMEPKLHQHLQMAERLTNADEAITAGAHMHGSGAAHLHGSDSDTNSTRTPGASGAGSTGNQGGGAAGSSGSGVNR